MILRLIKRVKLQTTNFIEDITEKIELFRLKFIYCNEENEF